MRGLWGLGKLSRVNSDRAAEERSVGEASRESGTGTVGWEEGGDVHTSALGSCCRRQPPAFPRLSLTTAASPSLLISAASIDLLHTSVSLFSLPFCVSVSPTPQHHSLQFPLTNIDRPLGGFPSSPLATTTSSSLSPSGAINFLPAWSCVSPYSRARGSRMGESGQMDRTLVTPPHSLSSLV